MHGPTPARARLRDSWWVYALAGVAVVVFPVALVVEVRCGLGRCSGSFVERLFSLDALGGLPRLYTSGLFVAGAVLGAWPLGDRRAALWWTRSPDRRRAGAREAGQRPLRGEGDAALATLIVGVVARPVVARSPR